MTETTKERMKRIRTKFIQQGDETLSNQDFWFLNDQAERTEVYEDALKTCMEAIRTNLAYAQFKDEKILHDAFKKGEEVLEA